MTERGRRLAFAFSATIVLAVALLPGMLLGGNQGPATEGESGGSAPSAAAAKPKATIQAPGAIRPGPPDRDQAPRQAAAEGPAASAATVRRHAAAFVRAYLRWEVGEDAAAARRQIERLASGRLAAALLETPPRPPAGGAFPPRGRLGAIRGVEQGPAGVYQVVARVRYAERPTPVFVTIERRFGKWVATALG